jgi:hypothetical protein
MRMTTTLLRLFAAVAIAAMGTGCTTAYDAYGNPRPVVEPGVAVLGAAAAGLLAYGLASDHHHDHYARSYPNRGYGRGYYGRPSYYRPGYCAY